ncbi:hypothetical protein [Eleftheria terrae]|uniref:hypothetical protein n=1 Tax=Eleftheria terrae TaxID=1597781 RepID=UPI00263B8D98|nr:hypothetical protein [Eleftheria terrae]WKB54790.1 hypothetical protein N7L95_10570 [Eleftheria terrae]
MTRWTPFPYDPSDYRYDPEALARHWGRLHAGDAEPLPDDPRVMQAWCLFHAGQFEQATAAGLAAGDAGTTVANKAQAIYAARLEENERRKLELLLEVAERAEAQQARCPELANAWFWQAFALGRYAQGISITQALSQGLGGRVKRALERTLALAPRHADAHVALGVFHAEVIDKLGELLGRTQGASKDDGLRMFDTALRLNPSSPIARLEYAMGLAMLDGDGQQPEVQALYEAAAACQPMDAMERLDVECARSVLEEE